MPVTKEEKAKIIEQFGKDPKNTGSPEVQIAILTQRINMLSQHLEKFKHDRSSKRGLLMLVGKRRALLNYLKKESESRYLEVLKKLDLRK
ncbi:MAG: 30S ribosomal protein S15 [Candidatus Ratteibacteria bacterium]|nr:30S ribosomal protein S15 [Candidatus Ratteibacteria bacterium]